MLRFPRFSSPSSQSPVFAISDSDIEVLECASDFRERLLQLIRQATRRIHIAALYLQADQGGELVLDALIEAARTHPDLDIRVYVDAHRARRGLIGQGKQAGNAAWYQKKLMPLRLHNIRIYGLPVQTKELFGVMHLKGFVLDDTVLYSGASLNNVYLHVGERYRFDRYHIIRHRNVADCLSALLCDRVGTHPAVLRLDLPQEPPQRAKIRHYRKHLTASRYPSVANDNPSSAALCLQPMIGVGRRNPFNQQLVQLLAECQRSLTICTPYFNLPNTLVKQIDRLLETGKHVEIIVGDKLANDFYIPPEEPFKLIGCLPYLYEMNLRRFTKLRQQYLDNGRLTVRLWKHAENSYHLKGVWTDGRNMLITGNNLNPRAFRLDLENGLLISGTTPKFEQMVSGELANIRQHTAVISHYTLLQRIVDYPEKVRKVLSRLGKVRIDRLFYQLL